MELEYEKHEEESASGEHLLGRTCLFLHGRRRHHLDLAGMVNCELLVNCWRCFLSKY